MLTVRPLPEFTAWLNGVKDASLQGLIAARIKRLEFGLYGDVDRVGDGVSELRIHVGAGWRVYYTQHGNELVILLFGGSKRTQRRDIKRARELALLLK